MTVFLAAAAYFFAARAGLLFATPQNISPFWPASGVAVAMLLAGGFRLLPGIVIGAVTSNVVAQMPLLAAALTGVGNTSEAVIAAWIFAQLRERHFLQPFAEMSGWISAAVAAPVSAAVIGVGGLWLAGQIPAGRMSTLLLTWWAGDGIGILAVAPVLVSMWKHRGRLRRLDAGFAVRLLLLLGVTIAACWWVFRGLNGFSFLMLLFPPLLLGAVLFRETGAQFTALLIVTIGVFALQPDEAMFGAGDFNERLLQLGAFLAMVGVTALLLGSLSRIGLPRMTIAVLLAGWFVSAMIFYRIDRDRQTLDEVHFAGLIRDTSDSLKDRMETYVDALRGGVSLFAASDEVTRDEWRRYAHTLRLTEFYPGVNGIGVIFPVRDSELGEFLEWARADGAPDFSVHEVPGSGTLTPDPAGWDHYIITYCEPQGLNEAALGLDFGTEANRASAARRARDYGEPQMTGPIQLVQDSGQRPGFVLYVPMYRHSERHDTVHSRRSTFFGWVYAPFVGETFLQAVLGDRNGQLDLMLFDGFEVDRSREVFSTLEKAPDGFERVSTIDLAGRRFTCGWNRGARFEFTASDPLVNAITLAALPLLLGGMVMSLQTSRSRAMAIAQELTAGLRVAEREASEARQRAESANAAKSEFLATMSHEIRTPMNGVIGYADLLAEEPLDHDQRQWVEVIRSSGRALLTIINDILDFSKIEAGRLELETIPFDIQATTREVVDILSSQAKVKGLTLTINRRSPLPHHVLGDPTRCRQILLNLVSNALKFTDAGSVRVELLWNVADVKSGRLHVAVTDTGVGIPVDRRDKLFQRFSQVDSSTTRRYGGTGLGLAICRHLVEMMGGEIGFESELGVGTTIWFHIPMKIADVAADASERKKSGKCKSGLRVLLVEDVPTNQRLGAVVLGRLGCDVELAENGVEAVDKALGGGYDVIYMDCQMPGMDGFEATAEIRRRETWHVPIIALTAAALEDDRRRCFAAGMDDFITKPFNRRDFVRTLNQWCR